MYTGSLLAALWFKPIGLVQRSAATWRRAAQCIHHVNQGELSQCCCKHDDSTIKIVLELLLLFIIIVTSSITEQYTTVYRIIGIYSRCYDGSTQLCYPDEKLLEYKPINRTVVIYRLPQYL